METTINIIAIIMGLTSSIVLGKYFLRKDESDIIEVKKTTPLHLHKNPEQEQIERDIKGQKPFNPFGNQIPVDEIDRDEIRKAAQLRAGQNQAWIDSQIENAKIFSYKNAKVCINCGASFHSEHFDYCEICQKRILNLNK